MNCKLFLLLFPLFLLSALPFASAFDVNFPDKTVAIPNGMKVHLGDVWLESIGTIMYVTKYFVDDWLNYTVDSSGTQEIYYTSEPIAAYVDGSHHAKGDGWTYTSNVITVTVATSQVSLNFATATTIENPSIPQTAWPQNVHFKATLNAKPVEGCQIRVYTKTYNEYRMTLMTNAKGEALGTLEPGEYHWTAEYKQLKQSGDFIHIEEETIPIDFSEQITPLGDWTSQGANLPNTWKLAIAAIVIIIAVALLIMFKERMKV
jgi:hypothetical protein